MLYQNSYNQGVASYNKNLAAYNNGISAENKIAATLQKQGHIILGKRLKTKHGEIDILSEKAGEYFITEVKFRKTELEALESITQRNIERCVNAFMSYTEKHNLKQLNTRIMAGIVSKHGTKLIEIDYL